MKLAVVVLNQIIIYDVTLSDNSNTRCLFRKNDNSVASFVAHAVRRPHV